MVAMSCVAPFETWPGIVLRTMSQVAMKHMRMTSKKINMGILIGSNKPLFETSWVNKKSFVIICHCYQTFEILKCKAIGSPIPMQPFPVEAMFFGTSVSVWVTPCDFAGFVLGKTWQFIHLGVKKHRGCT